MEDTRSGDNSKFRRSQYCLVHGRRFGVADSFLHSIGDESCKIQKASRRYEAFMQGQDGKALEYVLADCAEKVNLNQDEVQNLKRYVAGTVERKVNNSLYKSKMLRYNAFEEWEEIYPSSGSCWTMGTMATS